MVLRDISGSDLSNHTWQNSGDLMGSHGSNPGWLRARQHPTCYTLAQEMVFVKRLQINTAQTKLEKVIIAFILDNE